MTPVSSVLSRAAIALLAGVALASLAVNTVPGMYWDAVEWRMGDLPGSVVAQAGRVTPARVVADLLMSAFVFLIGKELWEAVARETGGFAGRAAIGPAVAVLGAMAGAVIAWLILAALLETPDQVPHATGWVVPLGSDVLIAYLFGRRVFGSGHPALQLLLFVVLLDGLLALAVAGIVAPGGTLRLPWLVLPGVAAAAGWLAMTAPAAAPGASERRRARASHLWPWLVLGALSWAGVAAAGLPPALGFLPLIPVLPRAPRSFGLFAVAEAFLTDPANRIAQRLRPVLPALLFLFGLTHGALDLGAMAPATWITLGALWIGKPLGLLAGATFALRAMHLPLPRGIVAADLPAVAMLMGAGLTIPALALDSALPGGVVQDAARLGLGLSLLAGPLAVLAFAPPRRRGALPTPRS